MQVEVLCRQCGGAIPPDAPRQSCPACLLRAGFDRAPSASPSRLLARQVPCPGCKVVLNAPENTGGRRLKCPKCLHRFYVSETRDSASATTRNAGSTILATTYSSEPDLPTTSGDLRDTFSTALLSDMAASPVESRERAPRSGLATSEADALTLFDDRPIAKPRRPGAAEARAHARRCPTCSSVVPAGMSICGRCGLDLETGVRIEVDDLMPDAPMARPAPAIAGSVIGATCAFGSLVLTVAALAKGLQGDAVWRWLIPIGAFGLLAAVQYILGKSSRMLVIALTFGVVLDIVTLIAMPIAHANMETSVQSASLDDDPQSTGVAIVPVSERLDTRRIGLGIGLVGLYALFSIYLISPAGRHLRR